MEPILFALITDMEMTDENTDVTTVTVPAMINRNGTQKRGLRATTVVRVMKRLSKESPGDYRPVLSRGQQGKPDNNSVRNG